MSFRISIQVDSTHAFGETSVPWGRAAAAQVVELKGLRTTWYGTYVKARIAR